MKNNYPDILKQKYNIELSNDPAEILESIAVKIGAIKNGEVDYEKVSLRIYNDIVSGRIKGVTFDRWKATY